MYTFEALAQACHAERTRSLFTLMGDGNKQLLVAAARRGIRLYHVRHEGAGLAMADGYARATGEVGVCSVTYSAGLTQLCTSLMVAARHRTPLVVIAGDLPGDQRGFASQIDLDEPALVRASGALPVPVRSPETAATDLRIGFETARRERQPVVLLAPLDVQLAPVPAGPEHRPAERPAAAPPPRLAAPADLVGEAARLISGSRCPVLVAGRGAVASGAEPVLRRLADRTGGLLATTLPAKGYLDGDPGCVGIAGSFADWRARRLLAEADCVVAVGASLNAYTLAGGELFAGASIVQIDLDPAGPRLASFDLAARGDRPLLALPGDAATVLEQLLAELGGPDTRGVPPEPRWRDQQWVRQLLDTDPRPEAITAQPARLAHGTLDPRELMLVLDRALPPAATVVTGVGNFTWFPVQYLRNPDRRRFLSTIDFVAIGQAVPTGIGVAAAAAEAGTGHGPVVVFEGDASFMMHVQELETAARYGLPLLVFVLNDGALGAEYHKLTALGLDSSETILPSADVCEVAEALGARTLRLAGLSEAEKIWEWFDPEQGPHVVDCPVSRSVRGPA